MDKLNDNLALALNALQMGYAPVPIVEGAKVPAVKWKEWQTTLPPTELLHEWFGGTRRNIAIVCSGLVIFDCDDPAKADLVLAECGETPHKLQTPQGGMHLGYRKRKGVRVLNQVKIKGMPIDIRTDGGLELIPCSRTEHGEYRWLGELRPAAELPVAKIGWTRTRVRWPIQSVERTDDADVMIRRARGYLATIEGAISGQGGHNKTFRVACTLIHKFGLTMEHAWPLYIEWNQQCEPPWSETELLHKLQDAYRLGPRFQQGVFT